MTLLLLALLSCGVEGRVSDADDAYRAGDLVAAEAGYRWTLEREPDHVGALYGLGMVYLQDRDPLRARDYFKRCARVGPGDYRCHKGLGSVALAQNLLEMAERSFRDALSRASEPADRAAILNSLALVRSTAGRHEDALALFQEVVELDGERGEYRMNLAECLFELGRHEDALKMVDEALSLAIEEVRFRALALVVRAQVLIAMTVDRLDPERCEETMPPVLAYLERADRALDQAAALGADLPQLHQIRQRVHQRRSNVTETCAE